MNKYYYYLYKLLNYLGLDKNKYQIAVILRGKRIVRPVYRDVFIFNKILFQKMKLFPFYFTNKKWEEIVGTYKRPIHTIEICNINTKSDKIEDMDWAQQFHYIQDFKRNVTFAEAPISFIQHPEDGVLRIAVNTKVAKHFGKESYNKWISQHVFLFSMIYFAYKVKLKIIYYDETVVEDEVMYREINEKVNKLNQVYRTYLQIHDYKDTFFEAIKLYNSNPVTFKKFLWNNEITLYKKE